jgi:hypothetical protein
VDDRGLLTSFLICKIGVALAALAFLGIILSMQAGVGRLTEREDLAQVADAIGGAIKAIDSLPGEAEMRRDLPAISQQFEMIVTGERDNGVQVLRVHVIADGEVERVLALTNQVNEGEFTLAMKNPSIIHLKKAGAIQLELV